MFGRRKKADKEAVTASAASAEEGETVEVPEATRELAASIRADVEALIREQPDYASLEPTHQFWDHYSRALSDPEKLVGFTRVADFLAGRFEAIGYLEIGSNKGLSMCLIGGLLEALGRSGTLVSIDPYYESGYDEHGIRRRIDKRTRDLALALYARRGLSVELVEMPSDEGLRGLLRGERRFEWVYVDGSHNWLSPMLDFSLSTQLMPAGGAIMMDDLSLPDIRPVADFVGEHLRKIHDSSRLRCFEWQPQRVFEERYRQTTERLS